MSAIDPDRVPTALDDALAMLELVGARTDAWNPAARAQESASARLAPVFSSFRVGPILLEKFCVSPKDSLRDRTILFVLAYRRVEPKRILKLRMAQR
jgi:hypothetical protein